MKVKYLLYLDRALNSWGDRCWEFAIGLYLIKLYPNSLLFSALQGILASCLTIIFLPYLGRWISKAPRLKEIAVFLFVQNFCVFIAAGFVALFFANKDIFESSFGQIFNLIAPTCLVVFSSIAQVASLGYTLSLEKDWILMIAQNNSQLSELNATLRRIDLIIKTIAPVLIGLIMEYSYLGSALFLMFLNTFSGLVEYLIMVRVYYQVPNLSKVKEPAILESRCKTLSPADFINANDYDIPRKNSSFMTLTRSIKCYADSFLLPGMAFGSLYLTVLSFDSITVGFLESRGVTESVIGLISLFGAVTGIIGTMFFQLMAKYHHCLDKIALIGYLFDLLPLFLSLVLVIAPQHSLGLTFANYDLAMILFLIGITLSRIGSWTVDLSINQLIQTSTPDPPLIGGIQNSVNTFFDLTKFIITACLSDLSHFYILIVISFCSALFAFSIHFCHYLNDRYHILASNFKETPKKPIIFSISDFNDTKSII